MQLLAIVVAVMTHRGRGRVWRSAPCVDDQDDQARPAGGRPDGPARATRTATMLRETLGHTRMLKWTLVGAAHWFVFVGFGFLFLTLVTAYGQVFDPRSRCR